MDSDDSMFKQHYIEILSIVAEKSCLKEEIYQKLSGSKQTKVKHVNELIEMGLITETKLSLYNRKVIEITDKGLSILRKMLEIRAELNDELVPRGSDHPGASPQDDAMPEALD